MSKITQKEVTHRIPRTLEGFRDWNKLYDNWTKGADKGELDYLLFRLITGQITIKEIQELILECSDNFEEPYELLEHTPAIKENNK